MLSRISEDDVKEEVKSLNRPRDDGNYIEKAINFNQQQELQKKQIFIKPNLINQTSRSDANTYTDYAPNSMNQTARSDANMNTDYASVQTYNPNQIAANNEDQSMKSVSFAPAQEQVTNQNQSTASINNPYTSLMEGAVASTPIQRQASSILSISPSPIAETLSKLVDANGNRICGFCKKKFPSRIALRQHYDMKHQKDINAFDQSKLQDLTEESSDNDEYFTPSNIDTSLYENTGVRPKDNFFERASALNFSNQNEPDATMTEPDSLSKTSSKKEKKPGKTKFPKNPVIIKFTKRNQDASFFNDINPNPSKRIKLDPSASKNKKLKWANYVTKLSKKPYQSKYGRRTARYILK